MLQRQRHQHPQAHDYLSIVIQLKHIKQSDHVILRFSNSFIARSHFARRRDSFGSRSEKGTGNRHWCVNMIIMPFLQALCYLSHCHPLYSPKGIIG